MEIAGRSDRKLFKRIWPGSNGKKGKINEALLNDLNALDFYQNSHPKSLGIEWCHEHIFPALKNIEILDANEIDDV